MEKVYKVLDVMFSEKGKDFVIGFASVLALFILVGLAGGIEMDNPDLNLVNGTFYMVCVVILLSVAYFLAKIDEFL